jgi:hypothetical protein
MTRSHQGTSLSRREKLPVPRDERTNLGCDEPEEYSIQIQGTFPKDQWNVEAILYSGALVLSMKEVR